MNAAYIFSQMQPFLEKLYLQKTFKKGNNLENKKII